MTNIGYFNYWHSNYATLNRPLLTSNLLLCRSSYLILLRFTSIYHMHFSTIIHATLTAHLTLLHNKCPDVFGKQKPRHEDEIKWCRTQYQISPIWYGLNFCRRNMQAAAGTDEIFLMRAQYVRLIGKKYKKRTASDHWRNESEQECP